MKLVFSEKCLEYGEKSHPENAERLKAAYRYLSKRGYEFIEPEPAKEKEILLVHSKDYVESIKEGNFSDPDTPAYENIYEYARLSAGAAILAAKTRSFSLMRPPGHHAGVSGPALGAPTLGFCYFNNVAIAVKKLGKKTLIIDFDGHHGNGTQEIFQGDKNVVYLSLHRFPCYPSTGLKSEGNCINFPLPPRVGDEIYLKTFELAINRAMEIIKPKVIAVSAGFDAYNDDLSGLGLSLSCFERIGKMIFNLGLPFFCVLEGGYGSNLGERVFYFLRGASP